MTDAERWFEDYDGPKTLCWRDGEWLCSIGWNALLPSGRVTGKQMTITADSPSAAVAQVKRLYEAAAKS